MSMAARWAFWGIPPVGGYLLPLRADISYPSSSARRVRHTPNEEEVGTMTVLLGCPSGDDAPSPLGDGWARGQGPS